MPPVPRPASRLRIIGQHNQTLGHRVRGMPQSARGARGTCQVGAIATSKNPL